MQLRREVTDQQWTVANVKRFFFLFSVLPPPSSLLSCGRLQYNGLLTHSTKDLKELHLSPFLWIKKHTNETKLTLSNERERDRAPPTGVEIDRVSMYKHLWVCLDSVYLYKTMQSASGETSSTSTPDQLELRLSCSCLLRPQIWDWKPPTAPDPVTSPKTLNLITSFSAWLSTYSTPLSFKLL